jgi:hypothetical protein
MSFTPSSRTALASIGLLLFAIMVTLAALSA